MKKTLRFTDEELAQANEINIIAYAQSRGFDVKKISNRSYKIDGYGGLYIDAGGKKWNCFSSGAGGGTIQFAMEMENKTWVEAVKQLISIEHDELPFIPPISKESEMKGNIILPKKNDTYKHIFAYLIKTRKIDKDVVSQFIKSKKIYEDKYNNCVFVGYDEEDNPKYASVRGTNTTKKYKRDIKNSDKGYPFCLEGKTDTLLIFESPIDLLSYLTLLKVYGKSLKNNHMISMGGLSIIPIKNYLKKYPEITNLILCVDNDDAAHRFCDKLNKEFDNYTINRHIPKKKDFNEELVFLKMVKENENIEEDKEMEM